MKNSTVISNPHATMNHVATVLESPDGGLGGVESETSSPLFGGRLQGSGMGTLGSEQVRTYKKAIDKFVCELLNQKVKFGFRIRN